MDLQEEDIREFVQIWKGEFCEVITPDDARQRALEVLELYSLLISPLSDIKEQQQSQCDTSSTAENPARTKTDK